jgi:hypothetical protein
LGLSHLCDTDERQRPFSQWRRTRAIAPSSCGTVLATHEGMRLVAKGVLGLSVLTAQSAFAFGGAIGSSGAAPLVEARVAMAVSGDRATKWVQVRLDPAAGAVAWLVPVWPGARVDEVASSWLDAIDEVTAPRPDAAPQRSEQAALDVAILSSATELAGFARDWGFVETPELGARVMGLARQGVKLVALVYAASSAGGWTRTVRVTDSGPSAIPLVLSQAGGRGLVVTASVIAGARSRVGSWLTVAVDPLGLPCTADPAFAYERARDIELARAPGSSLLEAAGQALLFPGVASAYVRRAAERQGLAPDACASAIAPPAGAPLGAACAPGKLAQPFETRARACPQPPDGGTPALACGESDDLALALSGLDPGAAWITRGVTAIPAAAWGADVEVLPEQAGASAPLLVACRPMADAGADGGGLGAAPIAAGATAPSPVPAPTRSVPDEAPKDEPAAFPEDGATLVIEASGSCSGSTEPQQDDACDARDPPASSTDGSCDGGDPPASSTDGSCDGGDPPASSTDGSCDGGDPPAPSEGTCDGASPRSSGGGSCRVSGRPSRRVHFSVLVLFASAAAAAGRRVTRPRLLKRASGTLVVLGRL